MLLKTVLALFAPSKLLDRCCSEKPNLDRVLFPLGATMGLMFWAMALMGGRLSSQLTGWDRVGFSVTYLFVAVGVTLSVVIIWLGYSGACHLLGLEFGGSNPSFAQVAEVVAWSMMPLAVYGLIISIAVSWAPVFIDLQPTTEEMYAIKYGRYMADGWSLVLITLGVARLYRISRVRAAVIVSVPAALNLLIPGALKAL